MAFVSLTANETYNPYKSQSIISKVEYPYSKLFYKYEHKPKQSFSARWVRVYYDYYRKWYDHLQYYFAGFSNDPYVVLHAHTKNPHDFVSADVYYCHYHELPLLVTLQSTTSKRYYARSDFDPDIKGYKHKNLDTLFPFNDEKTLLPILIDENDKVDKMLTYQVDKRGSSDYNNQKIMLTRYTSYPDTEKHFEGLIEKLQPNGFFCFRHRPFYTYRSLSSYFLFNYEMIMGFDRKPIDEIQGQKYNVAVYWSDRVKEPLLLEFNKGGHTYNNDIFNIYFVIRRGENGLYFEKLQATTKEIKEFRLSQHVSMFRMLSSNNYQIMIELLKKIESYMIHKIYLLLNKINTYTKNDVTTSIKNSKYQISQPYKYQISTAQPDNITVHYKKDCTKLLSPDYEYYEQVIHIKPRPGSNYITDRDTFKLIFLVPIIGLRNIFGELLLYGHYDGSYKNPENIYHAYYDSPNIKVHVYFHKNNHNIPLLFCHNGRAYVPERKDEYNKWVKVEEIEECLCSENPQILYELKRLSRSILGIVPPKPIHKPAHTEVKKTPKIHHVSIKFDISKTEIMSYDSNKVRVSSTKPFDQCHLFNYYVHTPIVSDFKTITFESTFHRRTISFNGVSPNDFQSLTVYFNTYFPNMPVLAEIQTKRIKKYYRNLVQEKQAYTIQEDTLIKSNNDLLVKLIEDSDKYNKALTFQINKKAGTYSSINISTQKSKHGYTKYTHSPPTITSDKGFILYNNSLLSDRVDGRTVTIDTIQDQVYDAVEVYYFDSDKDLPLLINLKKSESNSLYSNKKDEFGAYWHKDYLKNFDEETIKSKLDFLYYMLKKSIVIELDSTYDSSYQMKLIENMQADDISTRIQYSRSKTLRSESKIMVSYSNIINEKKQHSDFRYVTHVIELSSVSEIDKKEIGGLRFFMTKLGVDELSEIKFYNALRGNSPRENDRELFYYRSDSPKTTIYIYFYIEDPRALLFCYMNKSFKRISEQNNIEWVYNGDIKCYESTSTLGLLKEIYSRMRKKLKFIKDGTNKENISFKSDQYLESYKKDSYVPDFIKHPAGPFKLSKSLLTKEIKDHSLIDKMLDELDNHTFDNVNIYYKSDRRKILIIEFINDSNNTFYIAKDPDSKYWVMEKFEDESFQEVLPKIESSINSTVVYEIEKKTSEYSSTVSVKSDLLPGTEFTKYIHTPVKEQTNKASLVLHNGVSLNHKKLDVIKPFRELQEQKYLNVDVYFGKKSKHPLATQFNTTKRDNTFYLLKREDNNLFWEKAQIDNIDSQNTQLFSILRQVEFDLEDSLIILIGLCKENNYRQTQIDDAISSLATKRHINTYTINKNVVINSAPTSDGNCLDKYGFVLYEHNLTNLKVKTDTHYGLRFFIYSTTSGIQYREIRLKDSNGKENNYLYYVSESDSVYVYFYGSDPRPLLLCYNKKSYIPKSKSDYDKIWIRVSNFNECVCDLTTVETLLEVLIKVVGFLNEVNISKYPKVPFSEKQEANITGRETELYSVQHYNGNEIQIQVSYENKLCYRVYKHFPKGTDGNSKGFRLGDVLNPFTSNKPIRTSEYPLNSVFVYYNIYDTSHQYPLLVILNIESSDVSSNYNRYYKLTNKDIVEWIKISNNGNEEDFITKLRKSKNPETIPSEDQKKELDKTIEEKINEIKEKLGITFTEEQKQSYLFKSEYCKDEVSDNTPLIAGATGGSVGVVALGTGTGFLIAKFPQIIIPSIKPLL